MAETEVSVSEDTEVIEVIEVKAEPVVKVPAKESEKDKRKNWILSSGKMRPTRISGSFIGI